MTFTLRVPDQQDLKPRIIVFGVGGAGGNAVDNMILKNLEGANFVVANTDAQALQQSSAHRKIQMGVKITEGLGAGAKPEIGTLAAEESLEEVVDALRDSHMCFITAGMGGGTGTGAAPVIAQAARELGVLTVGVVTKPFQFEGLKRMEQAQIGIETLQDVVDTLIVIPNQNLFRLANEKTTFTQAFELADDVLYQGVKGVTDLMVRPGLINLDFADVRAVMDEMGKAMMGTGEASGEDRAHQAAEKAIANPLLDEISLKGARGVLINISGGNDMTLFELDEAANRIRDEVEGDAKIMVGTTLDPNLDGLLRVSVVATGIEVNNHEKETTKEFGTINRIFKPSDSNNSNELGNRFSSAPGRVGSDLEFDRMASNAKNTAQEIQDLEEIRKQEKTIFSQKQHITKPEEILNVNKSGDKITSNFVDDTRKRLQAAVKKEPDPSIYNRPSEEEYKKMSFSSKGTLNSILQRMTAFREKKQEPLKDPKLAAAFHKQDVTGNDQNSMEKVEKSDIQTEHRLKEEVPAFLRRQAN